MFREIYPPPSATGLSFYGGAPIGPSGMAWPRGRSDGRPLTFLMQWEAAALARQDATRLLPTDGVLYLFSNLRWGDEMEFRFVHEEGETASWRPLPIPDDLAESWGTEAAYASPFVSSHVPVDRQRPPRLQPCWPFVPIAIDYDGSCGDDDGEEDSRFWGADPTIQETLIHVQDAESRLVPDPVAPTTAFARPFAAFPQDWAAVRVVAAAALNERRVASWKWDRFMRDVGEADRAGMVATWRAEAQTLYEEAIEHPLGQAVDQGQADALWARMQALEVLLWPFDGTVRTSVNVSLGLGSDGATAIPSALIEAGAQWHSLGYAWLREEYAHEFSKRTGSANTLEEARAVWRASRSDEDMQRVKELDKGLSAAYEEAKASGALAKVRAVQAPTPNRIFGPPSYVQGYVEKYVEDRVLLLELTNSESIGLRLGEGVLQFMIRPDDLLAKRFDRVEPICSAY